VNHEVDYTHLQNLIMAGVQNISDAAIEERGLKGHDEAVAKYGELIDFLETMYVNTILAMVGATLAQIKHSTDIDQEVVEEQLSAVKGIMEAAPQAVASKLNHRYQTMVKQLNLPDAYQQKSFNETVADAIRAEISQTTPADSQ